jgi:PPK2 family polyphosphate:nucleotide phosphotransferase
LQEVLYAESKQAVLAVFQAMDTGGKDSTIRQVFGPLNPQGVRVSSFKAPTDLELSHDFLWRIHRECPGHGMMRVFNRSHYEDVLIVKVKGWAKPKVIRQRYEQINAFEQLLSETGTNLVKFYLHISKDYQKQRLQRRLDRPDKHWKFNPADLKERALWDDYRKAYETAMRRCSTDHAPWYIIPAERRWYRSLVVTQVMVELMESMKLRYPEPTFEVSDIVID